VLDVDGEDGLRSLARLILDCAPDGAARELERTARVRTGSGGVHLWLRVPTGVDVRNSAGRLGLGVDVRGDGGYVIAPPSRHPNCRCYTWDGPQPVAPIPAWLLELVRRPSVAPASPREPRRLRAGAGGTRYGLAALGDESERVRCAAEGTRKHTLNAAAFSL